MSQSNKDVNLKRALIASREATVELLKQSHIGADVKEVVSELLAVAQDYSDVVESTMSDAADIRLAKRRAEQTRIEMRATEAKLAAFKNSVLQLANEVEVITKETKSMRSRLLLADDPNAISLSRIETAVQAFVKVILEAPNI